MIAEPRDIDEVIELINKVRGTEMTSEEEWQFRADIENQVVPRLRILEAKAKGVSK